MRLLIVFLFCSLQLLSVAQNYDNRWMIGFIGVNPNPNNRLYATNNIEFNGASINVFRDFRMMSLMTCGIAICDRHGQLQFYTDGLEVHNAVDSQLINGFGLNPGQVANQNPPHYGYPSFRGCTIIPKPGFDSIYYLLHSDWEHDTAAALGYIRWPHAYLTTIDMGKGDGRGVITSKNYPLVEDSIVGGGSLSVCKHANGRDWWFIVPEIWSNCFYRFLITPYGIDSLGKQCIGDTTHVGTDRGSSCFSPDGSKYIWSNPYEQLNILDFDRCNGELSNHLRIDVTDSFTALKGTVFLNGVGVSPSSRYLYVTTASQVRQFDLWATNIAQSEKKIDNTFLGSPATSSLYCQLAPDGKIYINPNSQDTFLHVINYPDLAGVSCGFTRNAVQLPCWNNYTLPYYPNYRLGPLSGSACDSLPSGIKEITQWQALQIYPNPTSDYSIIEYGNLQWNTATTELVITDAMGRLIHQQILPQYSAMQKINTADWAGGLYHVAIKQQGQVVATGNLVKE